MLAIVAGFGTEGNNDGTNMRGASGMLMFLDLDVGYTHCV